MRYFLELSYQGTAYHGWQRQQNAPTVQQTLEEAFAVLLRTPTEITGAGRTDRGVHAACYVAHFDTEHPLEEDFCFRLNAILPDDIAIRHATAVPAGAHARFDALEREYTYYILRDKNPFRRATAWHYHPELDMERMNEAAAMLLHYSDFTTFSKLHSNNATFICRLFHAAWREEAPGELRFTIRADRFLRNMVRSIVGTLVDVGRRKLTVEAFREIIESRDRSRASGSAPAQGLFLTGVRYPDDLFLSLSRKSSVI